MVSADAKAIVLERVVSTSESCQDPGCLRLYFRLDQVTAQACPDATSRHLTSPYPSYPPLGEWGAHSRGIFFGYKHLV
jgi:hypothetical protein